MGTRPGPKWPQGKRGDLLEVHTMDGQEMGPLVVPVYSDCDGTRVLLPVPAQDRTRGHARLFSLPRARRLGPAHTQRMCCVGEREAGPPQSDRQPPRFALRSEANAQEEGELDRYGPVFRKGNAPKGASGEGEKGRGPRWSPSAAKACWKTKKRESKESGTPWRMTWVGGDNRELIPGPPRPVPSEG